MRRVDHCCDSPDLTVLNFGAGRQGWAIAAMMLAGELPKVDVVIFADTEGEPPDVYDHLWTNAQRMADGGLPIRITGAGDLLVAILRPRSATPAPFFTWNAAAEKGKEKGRMRRGCTRDFKIRPVQREVRRILGVRSMAGHHVHQLIGLAWDEVDRIKDSDQPWSTLLYPLVERRITTPTCIKYATQFWGRPPPRSACWFCPNRNTAGWAHLKRHYPELFAEAVAVDEQIRHGLAGAKTEVYLSDERIPLAQLDLRSAEQRGQFPLFGGCGEGVCS